MKLKDFREICNLVWNEISECYDYDFDYDIIINYVLDSARKIKNLGMKLKSDDIFIITYQNLYADYIFKELSAYQKYKKRGA